MFPRLKMIAAIGLSLAIPRGITAHPISLPSAIVNVQPDHVQVELVVMLEDLVLFYKIQAGKARRYVEDRDLLRRISAVAASQEICEMQKKREALTFRLSWKQTLRSILGDLVGGLDGKREEARGVVDSARENLDRIKGEETEIRIELEGVQQRSLSTSDQISQIDQRCDECQEQLEALRHSEKEYGKSRTLLRQEIRAEIVNLRKLRRLSGEGEAQRSEKQREREELEGFLQQAKEDALAKVFEETRLQNAR